MNKKLQSLITTVRGKNMFTYAIFVAIAAIFWFLMTLNDNVERDYKVKFVITDVPEDITFVTPPPEVIDVNVKGRSNSLVRYNLLGAPTLSVKFDDLVSTSLTSSVLPAGELRSRIRQMFHGDEIMVSFQPDSIRVTYTTAPGRRIAVKAVADVSAVSNHIVYGTPVIRPDSVTIFSVNPLSDNIKYINTETIEGSSLSDSLHVTVALEEPSGTRVEPSTVEVSIPVEPLVARSRTIPVEAVNVPAGYTLSTFPATVKLTVSVPMSLYGDDEIPVKAYADYSQHKGNTIPLSLSILPEYYRNPTLATRRVEYVLERE